MMDNLETLFDFDLTISDDVLHTEILTQIEGVKNCWSTKNYLIIYYQKFLLKNENRESELDDTDPESIQINIANMELCYRDAIHYMKLHCGIMVDTYSGFDPVAINIIYSMFIFRLYSNIIDYICISIQTNKAMFIQPFESDSNSNLSIKMARKTYASKIDVIIAVRYNDIVSNIMSDDALINPEHILTTLFKSNTDDYEYREIYNLYQIGYLYFDIPVFQAHIKKIYANPEVQKMINVSVIERLLPTFKLREKKKPTDIDTDIDAV
jgi:hypothetical protein